MFLMAPSNPTADPFRWSTPQGPFTRFPRTAQMGLRSTERARQHLLQSLWAVRRQTRRVTTELISYKTHFSKAPQSGVTKSGWGWSL